MKRPQYGKPYMILVVDKSTTACGCLMNEVFTSRRHPVIVMAKRIAVKIVRDTTAYSWPEIAEFFQTPGGSHSSVYDRYRRADVLLRCGDPEFTAAYSEAWTAVYAEMEKREAAKESGVEA